MALQPEFNSRGISVVVISFADAAMLRQYQELHQWPFTILADPERRAYDAFELRRLPWWRVFSPATLALYFRLVRRGNRPHGFGKQDIYQGGGDFLIDRAGRILFAHRSLDPADRPSRQVLLTEIQRIAG